MSEAFTTARELLGRAEEDAARVRAEADRYVRQREQEAEMIVAKARRLLAMAEQKAALIAATPAPTVIDLDAPPPEELLVVAAPIARSRSDLAQPVRPGSLRTRNDLDAILASAVTNAVHVAFRDR